MKQDFGCFVDVLIVKKVKDRTEDKAAGFLNETDVKMLFICLKIAPQNERNICIARDTRQLTAGNILIDTANVRLCKRVVTWSSTTHKETHTGGKRGLKLGLHCGNDDIES